MTKPFLLIAGPCVVESEELALETAAELKRITDDLGIPFIYKSSFDKANRTRHDAFRGLGRAQGMAILKKVRREIGVRVITDVHEVDDVYEVRGRYGVKDGLDAIQIPAFLCRQTDLVQAAAKSGLPVLIKKGQWMEPLDLQHVVAKARNAHPNAPLILCERGHVLGYQDLVVDMRSLLSLRSLGFPVVYDATHSVPNGEVLEQSFPLARAAVATGIDGLFVECHPDPLAAKSDAALQWSLSEMRARLRVLLEIHKAVHA